MGFQRNIAKEIKKADADNVVALKENHETEAEPKIRLLWHFGSSVVEPLGLP